ncbi:MAG: SRPBCC family protein [Bacteroidales bacterium]|nr:SRPBCC family protein [Bacteroidales bacterium]
MKQTIPLTIAVLLMTIQLRAQEMNIEADTSAGCFSQEEITIDSPMENVFRILCDVNHWPEWQSSVTRAQINGSPGPGVEFKWKAGGLKINSKFHTVNAYSQIGWTGRIWWIEAVHNWYLINEDNKTKVIVKESLNGFGSSLMRKSLIEGMKKNLLELKSRAEHI